MWTVTKFERRGGRLYPPKLCYAKVPMLSLARCAGFRSHTKSMTIREAEALARRIAKALNAGAGNKSRKK